jgi:hypothetical protein
VIPCVNAWQPCRASHTKGTAMIRITFFCAYGRYLVSSLAAIAFGVMGQ